MSDGIGTDKIKVDTFEPWFRREYPQVLGALILAIGNRDVAEEVAAEAFAKAYEKWDRVGVMASPGGWIYTVALNAARRKFKHRAMERLLLRKFHSPTEVPTETGFELPRPWVYPRVECPRRSTWLGHTWESRLKRRKEPRDSDRFA
jgi:DNA-directed RNA polymerase specialized sigma24 family protein